MSDRLIIYVVYDNTTRDKPGWYVCRPQWPVRGSPTNEIQASPIACISRDLETLRGGLAAVGLSHLSPMEGDDPVILETWI